MEKVIVVDRSEENEDGYLEVTDSKGTVHKISPKRDHLFPLFQPGAAIKLKYDSFKGKSYIADAEVTEKPIEHAKEPTGKERDTKTVDTRGQEIERNMWWKELGECVRSKDIDVTKPIGKGLRKAYYAKMFSVLDIKIEDKEL